jgi:hypothetical protein
MHGKRKICKNLQKTEMVHMGERIMKANEGVNLKKVKKQKCEGWGHTTTNFFFFRLMMVH